MTIVQIRQVLTKYPCLLMGVPIAIYIDKRVLKVITLLGICLLNHFSCFSPKNILTTIAVINARTKHTSILAKGDIDKSRFIYIVLSSLSMQYRKYEAVTQEQKTSFKAKISDA